MHIAIIKVYSIHFKYGHMVQRQNLFAIDVFSLTMLISYVYYVLNIHMYFTYLLTQVPYLIT
jgi:uncharacterized membrane protein (DUF485 family)